MKDHKKYLLLIATLLLFVGFTTTPDAKEIVKRSDDKLRGKTSMAEMTIKIVRPKWSREMTLKSWSMGTKYSLALVTSPAKEKGIVFLKRDKEIWNWIPSIDRNIKLPPSMMMQSWMGSDFNNDDLIKESSIVEDYDHRIAGDSTILGRPCYKIELIPKPDAAVVWGKILTWIDKEDYLQLHVEFFDEDGYLVNMMNGYDIKTLGGKILPSTMEMIPVDKEGYKTVMIYSSIEFDVKLEDAFFTTQNMKRVR